MSGAAPFTIERVFDAPRERVWHAFTDADALAHWFGPAGCRLTVEALDLRPGGQLHYAMHMPDGSTMWGLWTFLSIAAPERLEVIVTFSDAERGLTRHPLQPDWPLRTHSLTTFEDLGAQTRLRLVWSPYQASEIEQRCFDARHDSMRGGWTGTMDQLQAFLAGTAAGTG